MVSFAVFFISSYVLLTLGDTVLNDEITSVDLFNKKELVNSEPISPANAQASINIK